jgi:hypothetical protein
MLNERQDHSLKIMIENCYGKSQIKNKIVLNYLFNVDDENGTAYLVPSEFNSSMEARTMSDDFNAITDDDSNDYIVVSKKSGVYITDSLEERNEFADHLHIQALNIIIKEYKIRRKPLPNQLRLEEVL